LLLTSCPRNQLGRSTIDLIESSDMYSKGLPPVAGGVLDQSQSFIDAHRLLTSDQQTLKRKMGIFA